MITLGHTSFEVENVDESFFKDNKTDLFQYNLSWVVTICNTKREASEGEGHWRNWVKLEIVQEKACVFTQTLRSKFKQLDGDIPGEATVYLRDLREYPLKFRVSLGEDLVEEIIAVLPGKDEVIEYFCGYPSETSSQEKSFHFNLYWDIKDASSAILSYGKLYRTEVPVKLKDSLSVNSDSTWFKLTVLKKDGERIKKYLTFDKNGNPMYPL